MASAGIYVSFSCKENAFLNNDPEETEQTVQKCRRDTVVALAFLYRETSESRVILQDVTIRPNAIFANSLRSTAGA